MTVFIARNRFSLTVAVIFISAAALGTVLDSSPAPASSAPYGQVTTVWAAERDMPTPVPLNKLTVFSSYFDLVQPGPKAPGSWDACYRVLLRGLRPKAASTISIWASTHNRKPPGQIVAHPRFGGVEWDVWAYGSSGPVTFTLEYTELSAVVMPYRRWTYGTVHLLAMLRWLVSNGYLTGREQLTGLRFGYEFVSVGGSDRSFTVRVFKVEQRQAR